EVEKKWKDVVDIFTKMSTKEKYTTEIRFNMREHASVYSTSVSFHIEWGVFRRIEREKEYGGEYFVLERSFDEECKFSGRSDVRSWNCLPYTPEAELFFRDISKNIVALHRKLADFLSQPFDITKARKLLNQ